MRPGSSTFYSCFLPLPLLLAFGRSLLTDFFFLFSAGGLFVVVCFSNRRSVLGTAQLYQVRVVDLMNRAGTVVRANSRSVNFALVERAAGSATSTSTQSFDL